MGKVVERNSEAYCAAANHPMMRAPDFASLHPGFCNGPSLVNPFLRDPVAGDLLLSGIGAESVTFKGA